jgi:hypothetical protein
VRQRNFFTGKIGRGLIPLTILATLATIVFSHQRATSTIVIESQVRRQRRSRPKPKEKTNQVNTVPAFTGFKHETHLAPERNLKCSNCHGMPARVATDKVAASKSLKFFPYHDKCLSCHRTGPHQFFRGATPAICTVCHTRASPQLTKSEVHPFPNKSAENILGDLSLKFEHQSTSHVAECTTCHLNIARLDTTNADVEIPTCATSTCHRNQGVKANFDQEMLALEDDDIASKKNQHPCSGCHSTLIGGKSPPCTHYKLFDADGSYFTSTDFPKSAKLIAKLISECK